MATARLVASSDLGSLFVCHCHPLDALSWSLYSGDYVAVGGLVAVVNPLGSAVEVAPGTLAVAPEVVEHLGGEVSVDIELVEPEEASCVTLGPSGLLF